MELPAVDSTDHQPEPLMMKTERVVADSMGHRRQPAADTDWAGSTGHCPTYCPTLSEEPKKPESGTEADSTGRLLAAEPPEQVPLRLIPRIIVRRLLIWLVPRVGFAGCDAGETAA